MKKLPLFGIAFLCLVVHGRGFTAWFRADDFAWMGLALGVHNFHDLLQALFAPMAEGTIRPLSERAFFMVGYSLFGLNALPFRVAILATQCANLALVAWIGDRLSGVRWAGYAAAVFWIFNSSLVLPMGWVAAYNQVLCAFFLLLAFYFLLRWVETGHSRYYLYQWAAFLLGFGAMEGNVVYPALAAVYTLLCARPYLRRTCWLFAPSLAYVVLHQLVAVGDRNPEYAMHFTGSMLWTLATYWAWSIGPVFYWTPLDLPKWVIALGVAAISLGLLAFAVERGHARKAAFCLAWFALAIAPVLPLRDHLTEYYPFVPVIGVCWLGGWAVVEAWRSGGRGMVAALALAGLYLAMVTPRMVAASQWNHDVTMRVRGLVEGVAQAGKRHPGKAVLLEGVDTTLFWNAIVDHSYRLVGVDRLYLAPGSERHIEAHPDLGDIHEFVLPANAVAQALDRGELVVYAVEGSGPREITADYGARPRDLSLPRRVDVADPLSAPLLGPEWYAPDGNHRWMPKRATVKLAGPAEPGQKLYLRGYYPEDQLRGGPVSVAVTVDGAPLAAASIRSGGSFELAFPLPPSAVGKPAMRILLEVSRTFRTPPDVRDLGLAFGTIEVR